MDKMQELIEVLRLRLVLGQRMLELTKRQQELLIGLDAAGVQKVTKEMEPVLGSLNTAEKKTQSFLQSVGAADMAAWLGEQPANRMKAMAQQLLEKQSGVLQQLKEASGSNQQHLQRNIDYIDYSVNVMTQTTAGVTYGTPDSDGGRPVQGNKMFEANV